MVRLVLTFGKNPLPVLIAARRLSTHFRSKFGDAGFSVTPLYSVNSRAEYFSVRQQLQSEIKVTWEDPDRFQVEPAKPESVAAAIHQIPAGKIYHLHYTGGTKAMAVHAMEALAVRARAEKAHFEASYLDPNEHMVIGWNMQPRMDHAPDERVTWAMTPETLASLHQKPMDESVSPTEPAYTRAAQVLWNVLLRSQRYLDEYQTWKSDVWLKRFGGEGGTSPPGPTKWPAEPVPWLRLEVPEWDEVSRQMAQEFCPAAWDLNAIDVQRFTNQRTLQPLWKFLAGKDLEAYAFAELRDALPDRYKTSVRFGFRPPVPRAATDFDVDVAAVLGYQLVAVSCTLSRKRDECKKKGFEVWLRTRQIGGEAARAVLLCPAYKPRADREPDELEADLTDDIGARDERGHSIPMLRVWHSDTMPWGCRLRDRFAEYFREDLRWNPSMLREGA